MGRWRSTGDGWWRWLQVGMDSMLLNCNFKMIEMVNFYAMPILLHTQKNQKPI